MTNSAYYCLGEGIINNERGAYKNATVYNTMWNNNSAQINSITINPRWATSRPAANCACGA